jgi:hypothetical protein
MSTLLENKQMIHVAYEIIVLTGLAFYFRQKNKTFIFKIEDLAERIEEQDEKIICHKLFLTKLLLTKLT